MIHIRALRGLFFFAIFMEIHINIESKYIDERSKNKIWIPKIYSQEEII